MKYLEKFREGENTKNDIQFKKSLGQNFIFDKNLLRAIAADAGVDAGDEVI